MFVGSLANYNWSEYSDIDLHIVIDKKAVNDDAVLVDEFFTAKKELYNLKHNIKIKGFDVELYVQAADEVLDTADGIYSILYNKWRKEPNKQTPQINKKDIVKKVKESLKVTNRYSPEIIITNRMSEEDIIRLHLSCDCFVTTSHGEAICLPLLDAARVNNFIIAPDFAGTGHVLDLLNAKPWKIHCYESDVFGVMNTFGDLFTARETWAEIDIIHLRNLMREAYNQWNDGYSPSYTQNLVKHFSYNAISNKIIKYQ